MLHASHIFLFMWKSVSCIMAPMKDHYRVCGHADAVRTHDLRRNLLVDLYVYIWTDMLI